jgi:hypothetical protein
VPFVTVDEAALAASKLHCQTLRVGAGAPRPTLTAAEQLLVAEIRAVVARVDDLQLRAHAVSRGFEPEVTLTVDAVCSPAALANVLAGFPTLPVRLQVETLGGVVDWVVEARSALGVIATVTDLPQGLARHTPAGDRDAGGRRRRGRRILRLRSRPRFRSCSANGAAAPTAATTPSSRRACGGRATSPPSTC